MEQKSKEQIEYEDRLRYRLKLLKEQIKIAKNLIMDSLNEVKYDPNSKIDLNTVDGFVRFLGLCVEGIHYRLETKKIASIFEIQNTYFNSLHLNFSHYYEIMKNRKLTPHKCGKI